MEDGADRGKWKGKTGTGTVHTGRIRPEENDDEDDG